MRCPVCEWDAPDHAVDCEGCGKVLRSAAAATGFAPPVDGLEQTLHPEVDAEVDTLAVLEPTAFDGGGPRTPPPRAEGPCPFCGAAATGLVCDACGRRRPVPKRDGERQGDAERQLCPACFGRVLPYHDDVRGVLRCSECGVPLPLTKVV